LRVFLFAALVLFAAAQPPPTSPVNLGFSMVPLVRGWFCSFSNSIGWSCREPEKHLDEEAETTPVAELVEGFELEPHYFLGSIVGWSMHVGVGTPPQKQKLTLDTGSADVWITAHSQDTASSSTKKLRGSVDLHPDNVCQTYAEPKMCIGIASHKKCYTDTFIQQHTVQCAAGAQGYNYHKSSSALIKTPYVFRGGYGTDSNCTKESYDFLTNTALVGETVSEAAQTYLKTKMKTNKETGVKVYPKSCPYGGVIVRDSFTPAGVQTAHSQYQDVAIARAQKTQALRAQATTTTEKSRRSLTGKKGFSVTFQALTEMPPGQAMGMGQKSNGLFGLDQLSAVGPRAGEKRTDKKKGITHEPNNNGIKKFTLYLPTWKPTPTTTTGTVPKKFETPPTIFFGAPPKTVYKDEFFETAPLANTKDSLSDVWTFNMVGFMTSDGKVKQGVFNESAATQSSSSDDSGTYTYALMNSDKPDENVAVVDSGTSSTLIAPSTHAAMRAVYHDAPTDGIKGIPSDTNLIFAIQGADGKGYRNITLPLEQFLAAPITDGEPTEQEKELGLEGPAMRANEAKMCNTNPKVICTQDKRLVSLMKNDMKSMGWLLGVQWVTAMVHQFDFNTGRVSIAEFAQ